MKEQVDLSDRVTKLETQLKLLKTCTFISSSFLALFAWSSISLSSLRADDASNRVLRAKGLIIEDEAGRERILLGAPVPSVRNRVRTDPARVKELWAKRFPKEYMDWYKDYQHATNGLLILDEKGFDRIAVGDPVPDPNIGKRIGPSTGVVINDEKGFERSGYGLLKVKDRYRVVLGMDTAQGREGLTLALYDEGQVGVTVEDGKRVVYVGSATPSDRLTGTAESFHGVFVRGADGVRFMVSASPEK